jgi:hypothetical protein
MEVTIRWFRRSIDRFVLWPERLMPGICALRAAGVGVKRTSRIATTGHTWSESR